MHINWRVLWVFLLFLASAIAATALLLVSGWFIAASALAGVTAVSITFNYVIPSTAIRLLTFIRILSGYGANYFGHDDLLIRLMRLRSRVYDSVMSSSKTKPVSEQVETIERHVDALANRSLAVTLPTLCALTLALAVGLGITGWLDGYAWLYGMTLLASAVLFVTARYRVFAWVKTFNHTAQRYRAQLLQHLKSASLWSLGCSYQAQCVDQPKWRKAIVGVKSIEHKVDWWLQAIALTALWVALAKIPEQYLGSAVLIVIPLLLFALPEWLGPVFRAQRAAAEALLANKSIQQVDEMNTARAREKLKPHSGLQSLHLHEFCWLRERVVGHPISVTVKKGELIGVQGDSGSGKTSLLMSLAGLLSSRGSLHLTIDGQSKCNQLASHEAVHYSEQYPYVLSDTLRNNLLIARPDASDEQLAQALAFACLDRSVNDLDQWLGDLGRALSGGEQKRLGLARAWLTDCDVWLLDEPFEGLDIATQQRLSANIQNILPNRIVFIVSHRLATNLHYDQTLCLPEAIAIHSKI